MARANRHHQKEVKVVLIDTHYVETDPMSFKHVVQSLTGKESSVTSIEESPFLDAPRMSPFLDALRMKRTLDTEGTNGIAREENSDDGAAGGGHSGGGGDWRFSTGLSFKDLDGMILELPPVEQWSRLWDQYNL